jgi:hypothetical protein
MTLVFNCINALGFINNVVNSSNYIENKKYKNKPQNLSPNTGMVRLLANNEMKDSGRKRPLPSFRCYTNTFLEELRKIARKQYRHSERSVNEVRIVPT